MNKELKIETKFSLGDTVYFIKNNRIKKDIITKIVCEVCNIGVNVVYHVKQDMFKDKDLFSSLEELTQHWKNELHEKEI